MKRQDAWSLLLAAGKNSQGLVLFALKPDGTSAYTLSAGSSNTAPTSLAFGGGQFLIGGMTDGLGDFDPGPRTDIIDRGHVDFVSRYGF
jgi:hypothetical protein